jgi:glyoxylase-like metal-dependent hydrolase (beta-lactamase superfamily II)
MVSKIQIKKFDLLPEMGVNTYLIWNSQNEGILIDPSSASNILIDFIKKKKIKIEMILNTHGHFDHIGGNNFYSNYFDVDIAIHKEDAKIITDPKLNLSVFSGNKIKSKPAKIILKDNQIIKLGNKEIRVIHTPGHSKGSVSFLIDKYLFSGDTLFYLSIGRTDLPGGNFEALSESITKKLFVLDDEIKVFPGHGKYTLIGDEKVENPFFGILRNEYANI